MTQGIYLDADAIINAIDAGTAAGDPDAVLNNWLAWAQQEGAQIKVTDIVDAEVTGSQGDALDNLDGSELHCRRQQQTLVSMAFQMAANCQYFSI